MIGGESGESRVGVGVALLTEVVSEPLFVVDVGVVAPTVGAADFALFSTVVFVNCVGSTEILLFFK